MVNVNIRIVGLLGLVHWTTVTLVGGSTDIAGVLKNGLSAGCLATMHGGVDMVMDMKTTAELGISDWSKLSLFYEINIDLKYMI